MEKRLKHFLILLSKTVVTRFGENLLREAGVNLTELEEQDLRCGGLLLATNLTYNTLKQLAEDCMLQKCSFR